MHILALYAVATATIMVSAQFFQGFNYDAGGVGGRGKNQSVFEAEFRRAMALDSNTFNAARLFTMVQPSTNNTPIAAIPAAIATKTKLLLGMWASAGQKSFDNEVQALENAIELYGSNFTDLVIGLSVGSEDLYRLTPTAVRNQAGIGAGPDTIRSYISQVKRAIENTPASDFSIGHVDTWTAWVNDSSRVVIDNIQWLGFDGYPYFEGTADNAIANSASLFFSSLNATIAAAGSKPVWITGTGWPVSGKLIGKAEASITNARAYWQQVICPNFGKTNVFWSALRDPGPMLPDPSFGIIGSDPGGKPLFNLSCPAPVPTSSLSSSSVTLSTVTSSMKSATGSSSPSASSRANPQGPLGKGSPVFGSLLLLACAAVNM